MTIEQSPVTILGDLIEQLESKIDQYEISTSEALARAYAAGADQELEACCEWMDNHLFSSPSTPLRAARRPKPPSLKEQALEELSLISISPESGVRVSALDTIRRALEQLDD